MKKKIIFFYVLFCTFMVFAAPKKTVAPKSIVDSFSDLASKLVQPNTDAKKSSYAFVALSSDDENALAEDYVTDVLTEAVFNTGKVKIYERANLEKILSEQEFQASGLVDENTAVNIGKIIGVDYICYGNLKTLDEKITVNVRVVDVLNGEICAMSRATVDKDIYLKNVKFKKREKTDFSRNGNNKNQQITKNVETVKKEESKNIAPQPRVEEQKEKVEKSPWKLTKKRNDFEGKTIYTFILNGIEQEFLFVGIEEYDDGNLKLQAGVYWKQSIFEPKGFDFKFDNGSIVSKRLAHYNWYYSKGFMDEYESNWPIKDAERFSFLYSRAVPANFFLKGFSEHEYFSIRQGDVARKFKVTGLKNAINTAGLSWEKVKTAAELGEF